MSSFTFNSKQHRHYVCSLFALASLSALSLYLLGVYLEPNYGDLTRIDAYDERSFGWRQPQQAFSRQLYDQDSYDKYYDIVVLGDSFSWGRPLQQWQNYIVANTGWSILTINLNKSDWKQILDSKTFRETPPKVFILESVERAFPSRIKKWQTCEADPQSAPTSNPPVISAQLNLPQPQKLTQADAALHQIQRSIDWREIKIDLVLKYLRNHLAQAILGIDLTDGPKIALERDAPFSSRNTRELLIYKDDLEKGSYWRSMTLSDMSCQVRQLQRKIEANGLTKFVMLITPDKLTEYAEFTADKSLRDLSLLSTFADQLPDLMPRPDLTLKAAINTGELDVYLPDDTHWGSTGHRIAAEELIKFLHTH